MPNDRIYSDPDVIRAFWVVVSALEKTKTIVGFLGRPSSRDDQPWTAKEDVLLQEGFEGGESITKLSKYHLRAESAIRSRLLELDLIEFPENIAMIHARNEEVLALAERSYLDQSGQLEQADMDWAEKDSNKGSDPYDWDFGIELEEDDQDNERVERYLEEQERDPNSEDWSEIGDDLDAKDWEQIMGGPDDDDIEHY